MPRARLHLQGLERRDLPAQFGIPWANPTSLTVSFAPDGANVDGDPSELFSLMSSSGLSQSVWQGQILKAFQSWVTPANLNVGLVADDGSALGVEGYPQADSRFGDIRIFAVPMSSSVLAIATPPGDLAGTRTGDIILNSNYHFGVGTGAQRDLYTVILQEAGHALGVANSANTASAMYEFYWGALSGLHAEDVGRIRDLYGARPTNTWEPATRNETRSAAVSLSGSPNVLTYGDIASAADTDWYSFTAPSDRTATVNLQTAGLSLLAARITVTNSAGTGIVSAKANGPGQDLTINLPSLTAGATYFVRVDELAGTAFAAGQYRLQFTGDEQSTPVLTLGGQTAVDDSGTNESFLSATRLNNTESNGGTAYAAFGRLRDAGDVDVYRVRTPFPGMNQSNVLTATVRAFGDLTPQITVRNFLGLPVQSHVIADGNGLFTVVVMNAAANMDYHIAVGSQSDSAGDYELRTTFRTQVTSAYTVASGLLTILNPTTSGTIEVTGSAQIYFQLSAALTPIIGPSVMLRVYDAANVLRFQLLARAGDQVDGVALLGPGSYRVEISANGDLLPSLLSGYSLKTALLTDPTGVTPSDPNDPGDSGQPPPPPPDETPPPPPPSGYNYYNDRGYYVWGEQTPTGGSG